jgi:uncharacterized protein DUF4349
MRSITITRASALLAGAGLLAGCLLLSACSSGPLASADAPAAHKIATGQPASAAFGAQGSAAASNGPGVTRPAARVVPGSQSIVYIASLTLRSANAMATAKRAVAIVTGAGGYTSSENALAVRSGGTVRLQVKVPVPAYAQVLAKLSSPALGTQIALTQQATDVTQEVADVDSLVTSQQDAIAALQGLLRRAGSIGALLQVQQQISNDESTLESLQAQQRALDHETSYATISMTLLSRHHRAPAHRSQSGRGFLAGLAAGWRALGHATVAVLTALGAALPFLIVAVILAGVGYAGRRRFARRRTGPDALG